MNLKDQMAADVDTVFFNFDEMAESITIVGGRVTAELPAVKGCFTQSNPAEPGMDVVVALSESYASGVILGVL